MACGTGYKAKGAGSSRATITGNRVGYPKGL